jgi:hypothetical protein
MCIYENLAEPLAETEEDDDKVEALADNAAHDIEDQPRIMEALDDLIISRAICTTTKLPKRWIANIRLAQMYEEYVFWHKHSREGDPASDSTFRRVWKSSWRGVLRIRHVQQHARCTECSRLCAMREKAPTQDEKDDLMQKLMDHRKLVFADRRSDAHLDTLAAEGSQAGAHLTSTVLKIDLDGMDQAKFRVPRNTALVKSHDNLWRPTLHLVGCLVPGVVEAWEKCETLAWWPTGQWIWWAQIPTRSSSSLGDNTRPQQAYEFAWNLDPSLSKCMSLLGLGVLLPAGWSF